MEFLQRQTSRWSSLGPLAALPRRRWDLVTPRHRFPGEICRYTKAINHQTDWEWLKVFTNYVLWKNIWDSLWRCYGHITKLWILDHLFFEVKVDQRVSKPLSGVISSYFFKFSYGGKLLGTNPNWPLFHPQKMADLHRRGEPLRWSDYAGRPLEKCCELKMAAIRSESFKW